MKHNLTLKDEQKCSKPISLTKTKLFTFSSTVMSCDGYIFFLDASSQLFNKLMIITSYYMIEMGGVIQGELTQSVLEISDAINCFYLLKNLHFCFVHVHVYDTYC